MATSIRLARGGSKARPYYRIVVADSRMPRDGRFIERLGSYNPMLPKDHADRVVVKDLERVKYWIGTGAVVSDRIHRFLSQMNDEAGNPIMAPRTYKEQPKKSAKSQRTLDREQEKADPQLVKAAEQFGIGSHNQCEGLTVGKLVVTPLQKPLKNRVETLFGMPL